MNIGRTTAMMGTAQILLLAACGSGGFNPAAPQAPAPGGGPEIVIAVDPLRTRQTIADVGGGNFIHTFSRVTSGLDPVGRFNLDGLRPRQIRLRMALEDWEPQNDDGNPQRASAGGFRDEGFNHGAFLLAQEASARDIELTASIWDLPAWLVSNPSSERNRRVPAELYPELAESMAEWLRTARDVYGARISYVSFNEADIGVNVSLPSGEHAALIAEVAPRLLARGLEVRWLLGDCANMAGCVAYARPIWESAAARPHLGAFAFHTWDATAADSALTGLYEFGRSTGLPIRATEGGWDAFLWQRSAEFPSWTNALRLATVYTRVLKLTGASALLYWQMLGRDYNLNDGTSGYPAWLVLQALQRDLPAGSVVLETTGDRGLLYSVAARDGGDAVLVVVNGGTTEQSVRIDGLPAGAYRRWQMTAQGAQESPAGPAGGTLTLPRESVTILSTRR
jgi:O-glycosyl hydrolase